MACIIASWLPTASITACAPSPSVIALMRATRADVRALHAPALVPRLTDGTGVIRGEERTDDELAGLDRRHGAADLFDDAAVLVAHRRRLGGRVNAAVGPQVGAAHAGGRE